MKKFVLIFTISTISLLYLLAPKPRVSGGLNNCGGESANYTKISLGAVYSGFTFHDIGELLYLAVWPGIIKEEAWVSMGQGCSQLPANPPANWQIVTYHNQAMEYSIHSIIHPEKPLIPSRPYTIALEFFSDSQAPKKIFYWNKPTQTWVGLPTTIDWERKLARANTYLPYSLIVVMEKKFF